VSDASSLPEVAGSAGLKVPPHDIKAWTHALHTAKVDVNWRAQASEQGFREAARYRWEDTARQTVKSYQCALEDSLG
jgi:hypothetical protein